MKKKKAANLLLAIILFRCPRCRRGNLFSHSMFHLPKLLKMHDNCPHCHQSYLPEPGFYFGAMYFSYAFQVAIFISTIVGVSILVDKPTFWSYAVPGLLLGIGLLPLILRLSRSLMLHLFGEIKYDKNA